MEKLNLKFLKEDKRRKIYYINQDLFIINDKKFLISKNTANLSEYLNSIGYSLISLLNDSIDEIKCLHCNKKIVHNRFERKQFFTYKFCEECDCHKILKLYDEINCSQCNKLIYKKNSIENTCGDDNCIIKHRKKINLTIKNTHWTKHENSKIIINKRIKTRKENDIKLNRIYIPWNKGKTDIYSKETIEKIRESTINQMKNGKIKKTKQEIIFEKFLILNNIKYKYSFIYNKRQFDFLLIDYNIIVELQGDYWHANPKFWDVYNNDNNKKKLYETQKMKIKDDIIKKQLIKNSIYDFIEFWEYDIYNNFNNIKDILQIKLQINLKNNDDANE